MTVLPPSVAQEQKVVSIIYYDQKPIAIMDYLVDYPQEGTAYIGLLLVGERRQGHGQALYHQVEQDWRLKGISLVSLAVIEENTAGRSFWESQGFKETRKAVTTVNDQKVSVVCFEKKMK
jgi:ribosomal protein S18 acetylase RimI-like enzyme